MRQDGRIWVLMFALLITCIVDELKAQSSESPSAHAPGALAVPDCVKTSHPRLVVLSRGLVSLASEDLTTEGVLEQKDAIISLINVTQALTDPCPVGVHQPVLKCVENCVLKGPSGTMSRLDITNTEIEFVAPSSDKVVMHQEKRVGDVPSAADTCSLFWLPSSQKMTGHPLKKAVYGRPDPDLVTARAVFGTGEIFSYDYWLKKDNTGDPCEVDFPDGSRRAMARTVGIAVPTSAGKVTFRRATAAGYPEDWSIVASDASKDMVLLLTNHPVIYKPRDFSGHFQLIDVSYGDCNNVPEFTHNGCIAGTPGLDPQCTPDVNDWP